MSAVTLMQKHPTSIRPAPAEKFSAQCVSLMPGHTTNPRVLSSAAVLQGQKSVTITHLGEIYRLQVTKLGKLILTK